MEYTLLSKTYYADKEHYEEKYNSLKNGGFSTSLAFDIGKWEAFFVNLPEFNNVITKIYKGFSELQQLIHQLPQVAYNQYARKCLIDEIMLTNDIEGIYSTRKEIIDALEKNSDSSENQKRFEGLVKKYALLLYENNKLIPLDSCQDIRDLYDEIVLSEVDESKWPDGEIFRKEGVDVVSGTQQIKHSGLNPESKILEYMDIGLEILKNPDIPSIFKIAIFHYLMGYVHPFYDGNGRLSRFISSYLLGQEFNSLVALRLSYTIKNQKNLYYKAFDICNDAKNRGDITHFIIYFIEILNTSIESLISRLSEGVNAINHYRGKLKYKYSMQSKENEYCHDILWYLIQNALFSTERFSKEDLSHLVGASAITISKYIEILQKDGVPITIGKSGRKNVYEIDLLALDEYFDEL